MKFHKPFLLTLFWCVWAVVSLWVPWACTNTSSNFLPTNPSTPVVASATPTNNFGFTSTPTFTLQPTQSPTYVPTPINTFSLASSTIPYLTVNVPSGLAMDSTGNLYVAGGDGNFYIYSGTNQVTTFNQYNYPGTSNIVNFGSLGGLAIDTTNQVYYILQTGSGANTGAVYEFYTVSNPSSGGGWNTPVTTWNNFSGGVTFSEPGGIAVDGSGNVYVADTLNQQVDEFAPGTLNPVNQWGTLGPGLGQFDNPSGIAVSGSGASATIYVADASNQRIEVFGSTGNCLGSYPTAEGSDIFAICLDNSGNLYAADCNQSNPLVEEYSAATFSNGALSTGGTLMGAWNQSSGGYYEPDGLVWSTLNNSLYVADYDNNAIDLLTPN